MYGNQDWFAAKGLETSTTLAGDFTISSDYFINYSDPEYIQVNRMFSAQTSMDANRNVLYGYDTTEYVLDLLATTNNDTKKISASLNSGRDVKGFHNNISFSLNHVNKYLNILKYQSGIYQLIQRYKPGK